MIFIEKLLRGRFFHEWIKYVILLVLLSDFCEIECEPKTNPSVPFRVLSWPTSFPYPLIFGGRDEEEYDEIDKKKIEKKIKENN